MRRRVPALLVLLAALAGVAAPWPVAAAGHLVRITSTLEPATLTIAVGDTVTWRNDDGDRHRIRSETGPTEFDSGGLEPGESFRFTFTIAGTYTYIDDRNDELTQYHGSIVVTEASGGGGPGATAAPGATSGLGGTPSRGATIGMAGRAFSPRSVTIAAGGTVTFRNDDDRDHTATSTSGAFDSGRLAPGQSYRRTFDAPGTFPFLCILHPDMRGTVNVTGADGAPPPPAATPKPTPTPPPVNQGGGSGAATASARIVDLAFEPDRLTIRAGATVTWQNAGVAPHTVTAVDGAFESGQLAAGQRWSHTFATPGAFAYLCAIHPSMTGTVVVLAANDPQPPSTTATPSPTASPGASGPPGATPRPAAAGGTRSTDPPGGSGSAGGAGGSGAAASDTGIPAGAFDTAGLASAMLALLLIVGALAAGAAIVVGVVRRADGGVLP